MFGLSFWEIGLVMLVALLVLGPKRMPDLARTVGKGLRELRKATSGVQTVFQDEVQRPLQDIRDDMYSTVQHLGDEVQREMEEGEASEPAAAGELTESTAADEAAAAETRRRVEQMYADAAQQDALEQGEEDEAEPGWDPAAETPADSALDRADDEGETERSGTPRPNSERPA